MGFGSSGQLTPLQQDAVQQHEMLLAYVGAGFTRKEALELVKNIVATNLMASHQNDRDDEKDED